MSQRIELNRAAPDFALDDWKGDRFSLSGLAGKKHVLLVFNRGFT